MLKLPLDSSLDGSVEHELQVLEDLKEVDGVPRLHEAFYFNDVGLRALSLHFWSARNLQELAGGGQGKKL